MKFFRKIINIFDYMLASITWSLVNVSTITILPKKHPWYKRYFTLKEWKENRTGYTRAIDICWFIYMIASCYAFIKFNIFERILSCL